MIKNVSSFILCLVGFCSILLGQKGETLSYQINWITENSEKVTRFSEKYFESEEINNLGIPELILNEKISGRPGQASSSLQITSTEVISENLDFSSDLSNEFSLTSELKYGGNQAYLISRLTPYRKTSSGQIEKLTSFKLTQETRGERTFNNNNNNNSRSAGNSVLATGTWYKIQIEEDGIYRIDKAFLEGNGLNPSEIDPNKVNIYGNTGDQLPYDNSEFRHDDLVLNPTFFQGDSDNSWDNGEYLLFYGDGPRKWKFNQGEGILNYEQDLNSYTAKSCYFLRIDDEVSTRISDANLPDGTASYVCTEFDDFQSHESESVNLVKSGREWYGESFGLNTELLLNFNFPNVTSDESYMKIRTAARTIGGNSFFNFSLNSGESATFEMNAVNNAPVSNVAYDTNSTLAFNPVADNVQLDIEFDKFTDDAEGWLNYVQVQCRRELKLNGNLMAFRDQNTIGEPVVEYQMDGIFNSNNLNVWNITDPTSPKNINFQTGDQSINFKYEGDNLENFIVFTSSSFATPTFIEAVENQNLHAESDIDYVILSNPNYLSAAEDLAEIHRADGLNVLVTTPEKVYNEFSSGNPDVTAIKMLMKMFYDDAAGDVDLAPRFLCLFGDGTYQNRDIIPTSPYIISYQSENSISPTSSYISDDYFGLLDDDESELTTDKMDIAIGRIIANNDTEAQQMVEKIRRYKSENTSIDGGASCLADGTESTFGGWRNKVLFVSDDQDGNIIDNHTHMRNSEQLIDTIQSYHKEFNIEKAYADAYEQTSTPGGERYDDVNDEIRRKVEDGVLVVNYIGHGGEKGWAHERILNIPTIRNWTNSNTLSLFITATCELSRFDDPGFLSAGELIYLNPDGGAIAMMTTTRIVYSGSNQALAKAFYHAAFGETTPRGYTLGEAYQSTKNDVSGTNAKNFSLIGDPALALAHPKYDVFTSEINDQDISSFTDTLKALQTVKIAGFVSDENGSVLTDFNGFVYPTVYDKAQTLFTLANDANSENSVVPFSFDLSKNVLYNGKTSVANGLFEFEFVIPRDINYQVGNGRISYYAVDGNADGHGYYEDFKIGGSDSSIELNNEGPEISLTLNDDAFVPGGITDQTPILIARLADENGINTVGNGIGHDLKAVIDKNTSQAVILNDYYEADEDSFTSGSIRFQLSRLEPGIHTLSLKAWDTHNNSSESSIEFTVTSSEELALDHVLNYPNPFTTSTEFMFEHNAACNTLDVQIQIFNVGGSLVKTINKRIESSGYRARGIMWNGRDEFGDNLAKGVYVYKVKITTPEGLKTEEFEKLVLLK